MRLQGIGEVSSKKAECLKVGDTLMWDFGLTSKVVGIVKETAKFMTYRLLCTDGNIYERKLKKDREVCVL